MPFVPSCFMQDFLPYIGQKLFIWRPIFSTSFHPPLLAMTCLFINFTTKILLMITFVSLVVFVFLTSMLFTNSPHDPPHAFFSVTLITIKAIVALIWTLIKSSYPAMLFLTKLCSLLDPWHPNKAPSYSFLDTYDIPHPLSSTLSPTPIFMNGAPHEPSSDPTPTTPSLDTSTTSNSPPLGSYHPVLPSLSP